MKKDDFEKFIQQTFNIELTGEELVYLMWGIQCYNRKVKRSYSNAKNHPNPSFSKEEQQRFLQDCKSYVDSSEKVVSKFEKLVNDYCKRKQF